MSEQRFYVSGDCDVANADELRTRLMSMVLDTRDDLVLDCDGLRFLDENGLGVFTRVYALLARAGRGFRVVNLHGSPLRKVEVLGLNDLFGLGRAS